MRKINIIFILSILLTSIIPISCNKGPIQYEFDGVIKNSLTGTPISDVDVTISQKIVANGVTGGGFTFAGSAKTNSLGQWSISFERDKVTEFLIEIEKEDYFPIEIIETSANVSTEIINSYNHLLEPMSWVTFNITNLFPNEDDHFKLITQTFREGCEGCAENKTTEFFEELDTTFTYTTTAGEYVKFTYVNVTLPDSDLDSVFTTPFENNVYTITY